MTAFDALLVDLDDTLLNTTESADRVWRLTTAEFSGEIGRKPADIDAALDRARAWFWSDPVRHQTGRLDLFQARADVVARALDDMDAVHHETLPRRFAERYTEQRIDAMSLFPGSVETLAELQARGVRMALITNGKAETQRRKVELFQLAPYFEAVLIEGEVGIGKPDERLYRMALEACGASPGSAACVGDNLQWEVEAPQALGMRGIWFDWQKAGLSPDARVRPDRVIHRLEELTKPGNESS